MGCGGNTKVGWVNIDLYSAPDVLYWDLRSRWPFDYGSACFILAEHVFEHFERPDETAVFLRECLRCLEPGGTLRLVVPDAGKYLHLYCETGWDGLARTRPLVKNGSVYDDAWLSQCYRTKMEMINAVFRQHGDHKYAYDAETLILTLRDAGFVDVIERQFSAALDSESRKSESLYVEGRKAAHNGPA